MEIPAQWLRGGTSKCWVFDDTDLRATGYTADDLLPRLFGSPDHRQIDGVGGGSSTTSKAVILSRSEREEIDVVFTFAQVGIEEVRVDWGSNCGNCSTAAGLYAVENQWVETTEDVTYVRTYNTNSGQAIVQRIPTPGGSLPEVPTVTLPGTIHPGYEVGLGFFSPAGKTTGSLLPVGQTRSRLASAGHEYPVTMVDAGAPAVFVPAYGLGLDSTPYSQWTEALRPRFGELDELRRAAAVAMEMAESPADAERAVPKLGIVGPSGDGSADLEVLMFSMGRPHPAMPITGSVALTAAAFTAGTHPFEYAGLGTLPQGEVSKLRLRTPVGMMVTFVDDTGDEPVIGADRTARRLATSTLYLPEVL